MAIQRKKLLDRTVNVRDARLYVVATEGKETEAQYLAMFHNSRVRVVTLRTGEDGYSAPAHVLARLDAFKETYDLGTNDQLWLMIDIDRQRPEHLSLVCQQATQKGIYLAVSNLCFEFWLCLHLGDVSEILPDGRDPEPEKCGYYEKWLRDRLGSYNKSKIDPDVFAPYVQQAIDRATRLDTPPTERWPTYPGTHVYRIVKQLIAP